MDGTASGITVFLFDVDIFLKSILKNGFLENIERQFNDFIYRMNLMQCHLNGM